MSSLARVWEPIDESAAHQSLRSAAVTHGFEEVTVRRFLSVVNAHPKLVAHAQVFCNLSALLEHIQTGDVGEVGEWAPQLPDWIRLCSWAWESRLELKQLPGLGQFDEQPAHNRDNPHLGEGVDRHPVAAALWCRHESTPTYPPLPSFPGAYRYFNLQAHLAFSYIHARWKWVDLERYESYKGHKEWPAAPALSAAAARAVREFSHQKYDPLLSALMNGNGAQAFYRALSTFEINEIDLPESLQTRASDYITHLQRYFRAAKRVLNGGRPRIRRRDGGSGGPGVREKIPGYVHLTGSELLFIKPSSGGTSQSSGGHSTTTSIWAPPPVELPFNPSDIEVSGLCPSELLEPVLDFVDAENYGASMHRARYAQLAIEMAAQKYAWDWSQLTRQELNLLWGRLNVDIQAAYNNPSNKAKARYQQMAALLVKMMLVLGQPLERVKHTRIQQMPMGEFDASDPPEAIDALVMYVQEEPDIDSSLASVTGFGLPALSPQYKSTLDDELESLSRELANSLVLPDVSELGGELLTFFRSEQIQDERLFHIDMPTAEQKVKDFLRELERIESPSKPRITLPRITRALAGVITQQTGDVTFAWMATSDTSSQNEPRMHYTMHSTERLRAVYANAAATLIKKSGGQPKVLTPDPLSPDPVHIGCRFVLSLDVLKNLVTALKSRLTGRFSIEKGVGSVEGPQEAGHEGHEISGADEMKRYKDRSSTRELEGYDRDYLFYTYLVLAITTGTRSIVQPVDLFLQWLTAQQPRSGFRSGQWDKESVFFDKSRLLEVPGVLAKQFQYYRAHVEYVMSKMGRLHHWKSMPTPDQLLITFDKKGRPQPMTPTWVTQQFEANLGAKVPSNFSRAFLRTELLERGVGGELVDAFLGHASEGENPFSRFSTFDYHPAIKKLNAALAGLAEEIGLEAIQSQVVPYTTRRTAG